MSAQTRSNLKGRFQTGDQPSQTDFEDLIDSSPNLTDDGTTGTGSFVRETSPTLTTPAITEETPASASATGPKGKICFDASYIYCWVDVDTVKRAALSTW